ncbi:MAG: hypothetical protein QW273_02855 [Candidatus Pacearchaeota archaeon]
MKEEIIERIINHFFYSYSPLLAFLGGLFLGETLIFLGMLSAAGKINFLQLFIFAFLGGVIHDSLFFLFTKTKYGNVIKKMIRVNKKQKGIIFSLEKLTKNNFFVPFFLSKFIYGVREFMLFYFATKEKSYKKFFLIDFFAEGIWLFMLCSCGWLAGKGFIIFLKFLKGIEKILLFIFLSILVYLFLKKEILKIYSYLKKKFLT